MRPARYFGWSGVYIYFLVWLLSLSVCTCSDVTDIFGRTPLDLAKQCFSAAVVEYLQSLLNTTTTPGMNTINTLRFKLSVRACVRACVMDVGVAVTNLRVVCKIITCVSAFTEMATS